MHELPTIAVQPLCNVCATAIGLVETDITPKQWAWKAECLKYKEKTGFELLAGGTLKQHKKELRLQYADARKMVPPDQEAAPGRRPVPGRTSVCSTRHGESARV